MLFKEIYKTAGIRTSSHSGRRTFATRLNARGVGMRTIQKLMAHWNHRIVLRSFRGNNEECSGVGVIC
jgi:integrase